jgi:chromosome segregation ATPase
MSENYKIIGLQAENFKRLTAVSLKLDGKSIVIGGDNEQGKSSLIDAVWVALGGASVMKDLEITKPIKKGQDKARIVLDLGELKVTRKWTPTESLTVENKDGAVYKSPQAMLDKLMGKVFDPYEFAKMKEADRKEMLLSIVDIGIDLNQWAIDRQTAYDERTQVNRDTKALLSRIDAIRPQEAPEEEIRVADLSAELERRLKVNEENEVQRKSIQKYDYLLETINEKKSSLSRRMEEMKKKLKEIQDQISFGDLESVTLLNNHRDTEAKKQAKTKELQAVIDLPLEDVREQIQNAESTNSKIRQNKQRAELLIEHKDKEKKAGELTTQIEEMDKKKADAMAAAPFPVEGLAVDEKGITFNDLPFGQASSEEKIRVGMAIAMAMSPSIKVIRISGGESLDTKHLALILETAEKSGYQVLMERVGDPGEIGVIIENGEVKK